MAGPRLKTGLFLQARISSTRLPAKALLSLEGKPVLQRVMESLRSVKADVYALLTDEESFTLFEPLAQEAGFLIFPGPKEDVLKRYCLAIDYYKVEQVIRATGDNPLVSAQMANLLLKKHRRFQSELSYYFGSPLGTGVEIVLASSLKKALEKSTDPYEHEHITTYLLRRPNEHRILAIKAPRRWYYPEGRVTLDTSQDFELLKRIYADLSFLKRISCRKIIKWLKKNQKP